MEDFSHMMTFTGLSSINFESPYGRALIPPVEQDPIPVHPPEVSRPDACVKKTPDDPPQKKQPNNPGAV